MAIKPFPDRIPTKLPPAKLYLDDIKEIMQILTDSSADCQPSFVAGKSKCDTLDDLKELRGRTTHFVMNISSPGKHQTLELTTSTTQIHVYEMGDQLGAWSKYVRVAAIFERRRLRLKSAVRSAGLWSSCANERRAIDAAQRERVRVYAVSFPSPESAKGQHLLDNIAKHTGGKAFFPASEAEMASAPTSIAIWPTVRGEFHA